MGNKNCENCDPKNSCCDAYQRLGKTAGPSVALKVIVAFLIPIMVFVGVAILCQRLLPSMPGARHDLKQLVSFLIAGGVTVASLYLIKMINARLTKDKQDLE